MYKVLDARRIVPNVHCLTLEAPAVAREVLPGQFIIVRVEEDGERIPLSVADWDRETGTITVFVCNVGNTTNKIASLRAGSELPTVVGPLGNATEIGKFGSVLCVCGCYGIGSVYPIARALKENGNKVFTVMEARSAYLFYWEEKHREAADKLFFITRDGSKGIKGHVTRLPEVMASINEPIHRIVINGCTMVMKRGSEVTRPFGIKTVVSLNPIMIDGTGMCGVCRVTVGGQTKFACVDGPDFDGHDVDWEELFQRRRSYVGEELLPMKTSGCGGHSHGS